MDDLNLTNVDTTIGGTAVVLETETTEDTHTLPDPEPSPIPAAPASVGPEFLDLSVEGVSRALGLEVGDIALESAAVGSNF